MKGKYVVIIILMLTARLLSGQNFADFREQVLKFEAVNNFGDRGFGLYDFGEMKYKIFNWQFKAISEIPIKKGEGPGELKYNSVRACIIGNRLYINPYIDTFIDIFDITSGRYIKRYKTGLLAELFPTSQQKLLLFNKSLLENTKNNGKPELARIVEPETGIVLKKIHFPVYIDMSKYSADEQEGISDHILFFLDAKDIACILNQKEQRAYFVDFNGQLLSKRDLPGFFDFRVEYARMGDNNIEVHSSTSFYEGFFVSGNNLIGNYYASSREKSMTEDPGAGYIHFVRPENTYTEMKNKGGRFHLLHGDRDVIYLINQDNYEVSQVKTATLKQLPEKKVRQ